MNLFICTLADIQNIHGLSFHGLIVSHLVFLFPNTAGGLIVHMHPKTTKVVDWPYNTIHLFHGFYV